MDKYFYDKETKSIYGNKLAMKKIFFLTLPCVDLYKYKIVEITPDNKKNIHDAIIGVEGNNTIYIETKKTLCYPSRAYLAIKPMKFKGLISGVETKGRDVYFRPDRYIIFNNLYQDTFKISAFPSNINKFGEYSDPVFVLPQAYDRPEMCDIYEMMMRQTGSFFLRGSRVDPDCKLCFYDDIAEITTTFPHYETSIYIENHGYPEFMISDAYDKKDFDNIKFCF